MVCSGANLTSTEQEFSGGVLITKVTIMAAVLVSSVVGNLTLVFRIYRKHNKWLAIDWLLRTLALFGISNSVLSIGVHLTSMLTGKWLFGNVGCQMYGILSSVLMSGWVWMLAITSLERYKSLMSSSDHVSLFSEVNTRIISWGTVLLLAVLYLGPIYGWGEYSYLKGKLDISIDVANHSRANASTYRAERDDVIRRTFYAHLQAGGGATGELSAEMKDVFLINDGGTVLRLLRYSSLGVVLSLRAYKMAALDCLWRRYLSRDIHDALARIIANNVTMTSSRLGRVDVNVNIVEQDYSRFRNVYYVYQRSLTCGLDYSPVNNNIYTFAAFNWLITICLPLAVTVYFSTRMFAWDRRGALYRAYSYSSALCDAILAARVVVWTTFLSVISALVHSGVQLAAGLGIAVHGYVLFTSAVLLYLSWSLLPVCYWFATHCDCCACCCSWCSARCSACVVRGSDIDWPIGSGDQRKHHQVGGRPDPDVRTRLLTVNRTYSEGSAVISDRNSIRLSSNNDEETTL